MIPTLCKSLNGKTRFLVKRLESVIFTTEQNISLTCHNTYSKNLQRKPEILLHDTRNQGEPQTGKISIEPGLLLENTFAWNYMKNSNNYTNTVAQPLLPSTKQIPDSEADSLIQTNWTSFSPNEFIDNFEKISHYAFEKEQDISNRKYSEIVKSLQRKCPKFSDCELRKILKCLRLWNKYVISTSVWGCIDAECTKRMSDWSPDNILLTCDLFYKLKFEHPAGFIWNSVKHLSNNPDKLSTPNLVQFAYFINICRRPSLKLYRTEYCLDKHINELSIEEVGIVAMGFFKSQNKIQNVSLINQIIRKTIRSVNDASDVSLASIVKILRYASI